MTDTAQRHSRPMIDEVVHTTVLREKRHWQTIAEAREPLPMVLHCPRCGLQHVDAPDPARDWTNPPHRSHLCAGCELIWRPADVATVGVEKIATRGRVDTEPGWIRIGNAETAAGPDCPPPSSD